MKDGIDIHLQYFIGRMTSGRHCIPKTGRRDPKLPNILEVFNILKKFYMFKLPQVREMTSEA